MEPPLFPPGGPPVVRAAPGTVASLHLPLPFGSQPFHYHWSRAGASLDDRFITSDDAGGVRLTVSAARTGDSGVYTLQASNAAGKDTTRVRLEVSPDEAPIGDDPPNFLRRLQDLTVKVGTRTRFLVEIVSSTECKVTWYRNERRLMETERVALVRDGNFWCADVATVSVDDAGRWTCTAENVGGRASCSAHLNVLVPKAYKRPEFVEELRALLTEQGTVSLECKVVGVPTPVLRWFKDSREIKAGDVFALTANAEDPTSLGTYTCEAVNCMGRAYSSSKVHVVGRASREGSARPSSGGLAPDPPPIFTKELEDQFVRICDPLTLGCHIVVPPWPRSVVWYNKEGKIEPNERYHVLEDGVGGYIVEVCAAEWADEGEWKCVATTAGGRVGMSACYVSMDVPKNYRKPRFMENLQAVLTEEGLVSFECKVVGFPTPVLSWFKDGQELKPGDVYQLTGTNSLGSYCCIARNCMGQASSSAELTVEDIQNQLNEEEKHQLFSKNQAPKFLQGLKSVEAKIDEPFRFTIKVAIPPEPSLLWYRDDQPVDESSRCHHAKEDHGVFNLDLQNLEFLDQAEWKCVAMNDFGQSVTSCFLKLIIPRHYKKPRFLENLQAILSDEGAVNLECKVIGVPQPVLKWYKDGEELKPGDIHRIISGQDGTCCLGTYTCEAQNCMGIAASSASLLGFDDSMKVKTKKKSEDQNLQRNLSLSTIHEERTSQMYDTPIGDRTLDDKGEISFSFDGKEVSVSLYETPDLTEEEALQIVEMYADQLSENVTEHNVVELPPLRFVKETSTSGNLLMEAIIIDVSPEYFIPPEEDLRTEADIEDISIADESGPPQLSLDQEISGQDYLEKTMALSSDEKSDIPQKLSKMKSDSQKSGDDYFSLSRDQSLSEEKKDDETQMLSESDLQSFASARSSGKHKSKSLKPLPGETLEQELAEPSEITKTLLFKDNIEMISGEPDIPIPKRKRRSSRGSRRSSSGSEKSLKDDKTLPKLEQTPKKLMADEEYKMKLSNVVKYLSKVINEIQIIERDIILQSELMSSAATASKSLELISSLINPLSETHSIAESAYVSPEIRCALFNSLPKPYKVLHQSLTIIEKCIDVESDSKTLVKKTCILLMEKCGNDIQNVVSEINSLILKKYINVEETIATNIESLGNEMITIIKFSMDTIKARNLLNKASEIKSEEPSQEVQHSKDTQKAIYELKSPLKSLLRIFQSTESSDIILTEMTASVQDLQEALEQIESLSVKESTSSLIKYNTEIIETVMDSVLNLRSSFEQLSIEARKDDNENTLKNVLSTINLNLNEISSYIDIFENNVGKFDVLQSENKLEILQKMAQTLISFENSLLTLDQVSALKIHMVAFHKNLTKVLENVIESNEATKYISFMEICQSVNRVDNSLKNMKSPDAFSLTCIRNTLGIIQKQFVQFVFDPQLNSYVLNNIEEIQTRLLENMNLAEEVILETDLDRIRDLPIIRHEKSKASLMIESIEQSIAALGNIVTEECVSNLRTTLTPILEKFRPNIEELKQNIASMTAVETEHEEHASELSDISVTQTLAIPLCELNQNIIVLNQTIMENIESFKDNFAVATLYAQPLQELQRSLEILQNEVISEHGEEVLPLEISRNIANVVQNLHNSIILIQEQSVVETADELSTLEDISGIKTTAEIIPLEHLHLPTTEEVFAGELNEKLNQVQTDSAVAKSLQTLNDHIAVLQCPDVIELLETLSDMSNHTSLKSVGVSLVELNEGIQEILHPILIENTQQYFDSVNLAKLIEIAEPMQDLHQCLSVVDTSNIPIYENILKIPSEIIHSAIEKLLNFKEELRTCLNIIPTTETEKANEISNNISSLVKMCRDFKNIFEDIEGTAVSLKPEVSSLKQALNTFLEATESQEHTDITGVRILTEELYQKLLIVQDELIQSTPQPTQTMAQEVRLIETVHELENKIAVLEQYQFVDFSHASDIDSCILPQVAVETQANSLIQINDFVNSAVNIVQDINNETATADLMILEDFFKTFKHEFSILRCLITKRPTHKKLVRLLQEFCFLRGIVNDLKRKRSDLSLTKDVDQILTNFLFNLDLAMEDIKNSLIKIIDSSSRLLFEAPVETLDCNMIILSDITKSHKNDKMVNLTNKFIEFVKCIRPNFDGIKAAIFEEFQLVDSYEDKKVIDENFDSFLNHIENEMTNQDEDDIKQIIETILSCLQKHQDFKNVVGQSKILMILKCLSECSTVFKNILTNGTQPIKNVIIESEVIELKTILCEMVKPLQGLRDQLICVQEQILPSADEEILSIDVTSTESYVQALTEINKDVVQLLESENTVVNETDLSVIDDLDNEIHIIQENLRSMETTGAAQIVKEIVLPLEEIEKSLLLVKEKGSMNNTSNITKDINSNISSLEYCLNCFIELESDLLAISEILINIDIKKCLILAREISNSFSVTEYYGDKHFLKHTTSEKVKELKNMLMKFDWLNADSFYENRNDSEIEITKRVFLSAYQLLSELNRVIPNLHENDNHVLQGNAKALMEHIEQYLEFVETVEKLPDVAKIDEILKTADIVKELRQHIHNDITTQDNRDLHSEGDSTLMYLMLKLQRTLSEIKEQSIDSVIEIAQDLNDDKWHHLIEIKELLQNNLKGISGIEANIDSEDATAVSKEDIFKTTDIKYGSMTKQETEVSDAQEKNEDGQPIDCLSEIFPEDIHKQSTETGTTPYEQEMKYAEMSDAANQKHEKQMLHEKSIEGQQNTTQDFLVSGSEKESDLFSAESSYVDIPTIGILAQHVNEYISEEVVEIIGKLVTILDMKELEQSVNVAKQMQGSILSLQSSPAESVEILKNDNSLKLHQYMLDLQESLNILNVITEDNAEELVHSIEEKSLERITKIAQNLQADILALISVHPIFQKSKDIDAKGEIILQKQDSDLLDMQELDSTAEQSDLINMQDNHYENIEHEEIEDSYQILSKQDRQYDEENNGSMKKLQMLLSKVIHLVDLYATDESIDETEMLRNVLDEVQTVIIKLKRDFDSSVNDTLNETLEDLECSVRSVQLQIDENSAPELLKDACATLQLLVTNMSDIKDHIGLPIEKININALLQKCFEDSEQTIKLLNDASKPGFDGQMANVISKLDFIKDTLKKICLSFRDDADTLINNGIDVLQKLNHMEEDIFSLEKDIEEVDITSDIKDSIVIAIHTVYENISNMRSTISSIQKEFMYVNYGKPSENFLRSLKNVAIIRKLDNEDNWKRFEKVLRQALNHFEDIKFYVNLDKTARVPSDAAFTKIILEELTKELNEVVRPNILKLNPDMFEQVEFILKTLKEHSTSLESRSTLEVKEKIPIFKNISVRILSLTESLLKYANENIASEQILPKNITQKQENVAEFENAYPLDALHYSDLVSENLSKSMNDSLTDTVEGPEIGSDTKLLSQVEDIQIKENTTSDLVNEMNLHEKRDNLASVVIKAEHREEKMIAATPSCSNKTENKEEIQDTNLKCRSEINISMPDTFFETQSYEPVEANLPKANEDKKTENECLGEEDRPLKEKQDAELNQVEGKQKISDATEKEEDENPRDRAQIIHLENENKFSENTHVVKKDESGNIYSVMAESELLEDETKLRKEEKNVQAEKESNDGEKDKFLKINQDTGLKRVENDEEQVRNEMEDANTEKERQEEEKEKQDVDLKRMEDEEIPRCAIDQKEKQSKLLSIEKECQNEEDTEEKRIEQEQKMRLEREIKELENKRLGEEENTRKEKEDTEPEKERLEDEARYIEEKGNTELNRVGVEEKLLRQTERPDEEVNQKENEGSKMKRQEQEETTYLNKEKEDIQTMSLDEREILEKEDIESKRIEQIKNACLEFENKDDAKAERERRGEDSLLKEKQDKEIKQVEEEEKLHYSFEQEDVERKRLDEESQKQNEGIEPNLPEQEDTLHLDKENKDTQKISLDQREKLKKDNSEGKRIEQDKNTRLEMQKEAKEKHSDQDVIPGTEIMDAKAERERREEDSLLKEKQDKELECAEQEEKFPCHIELEEKESKRSDVEITYDFQKLSLDGGEKLDKEKKYAVVKQIEQEEPMRSEKENEVAEHLLENSREGQNVIAEKKCRHVTDRLLSVNQDVELKLVKREDILQKEREDTEVKCIEQAENMSPEKENEEAEKNLLDEKEKSRNEKNNAKFERDRLEHETTLRKAKEDVKAKKEHIEEKLPKEKIDAELKLVKNEEMLCCEYQQEKEETMRLENAKKKGETMRSDEVVKTEKEKDDVLELKERPDEEVKSVKDREENVKRQEQKTMRLENPKKMGETMRSDEVVKTEKEKDDVLELKERSDEEVKSVKNREENVKRQEQEKMGLEQQNQETEKKYQEKEEKSRMSKEDAKTERERLEQEAKLQKDKEDAEFKRMEKEEKLRYEIQQQEEEAKRLDEEEKSVKVKKDAEIKRQEQEEKMHLDKELQEAEKNRQEKEEKSCKAKEDANAEKERLDQETKSQKEKEDADLKRMEEDEKLRFEIKLQEAKRLDDEAKSVKDKDEEEDKRQEQEEEMRLEKELQEAEIKRQEKEVKSRKAKEDAKTEKERLEQEAKLQNQKEDADLKRMGEEEKHRFEIKRQKEEAKRLDEEAKSIKDKEETEAKRQEQEEKLRMEKELKEAEKKHQEKEEKFRKAKEDAKAEKERLEQEAKLQKEKEDADLKRMEEDEKLRFEIKLQEAKRLDDEAKSVKDKEEEEDKRQEQEEEMRLEKELQEAEKKRQEKEVKSRKAKEDAKTEKERLEQEAKLQNEKEDADLKRMEEEEKHRFEIKRQEEEAKRLVEEAKSIKDKEETETKRQEQEEKLRMEKELKEAEKKHQEKEEKSRKAKEDAKAEKERLEQEAKLQKEKEDADLKRMEEDEKLRFEIKLQEAKRLDDEAKSVKDKEEEEDKRQDQEEEMRLEKELQEAEKKRQEKEVKSRKAKEDAKTEKERLEQEAKLQNEKVDADLKRMEEEEKHRFEIKRQEEEAKRLDEEAKSIKDKEETEAKRQEQEEKLRMEKELKEAEKKHQEKELKSRKAKEDAKAEKERLEQEAKLQTEKEDADIKSMEEKEKLRFVIKRQEEEVKRSEEEKSVKDKEEAEAKRQEQEEKMRLEKELQEVEQKHQEEEEKSRKAKEDAKVEKERLEQEAKLQKGKEDADLKRMEEEEKHRFEIKRQEEEAKRLVEEAKSIKDKEETETKRQEQEEKLRMEKELKEAEKKHQEKEEKSRKAKEDAKAEKERLEQEAKLQKEKEDADLKRMEEDEKLRFEIKLQEAKRLDDEAKSVKDKEEADAKSQEQEENMRLEKEFQEAEKKFQEKEEKSRKAKEVAKVEKERLEQEEKLQKEKEDADLKRMEEEENLGFEIKRQEEEAKRLDEEAESIKDKEETEAKRQEQEEKLRMENELKEAEKKRQEKEEKSRKAKEHAKAEKEYLEQEAKSQKEKEDADLKRMEEEEKIRFEIKLQEEEAKRLDEEAKSIKDKEEAEAKRQEQEEKLRMEKEYKEAEKKRQEKEEKSRKAKEDVKAEKERLEREAKLQKEKEDAELKRMQAEEKLRLEIKLQEDEAKRLDEEAKSIKYKEETEAKRQEQEEKLRMEKELKEAEKKRQEKEEKSRKAKEDAKAEKERLEQEAKLQKEKEDADLKRMEEEEKLRFEIKLQKDGTKRQDEEANYVKDGKDTEVKLQEHKVKIRLEEENKEAEKKLEEAKLTKGKADAKVKYLEQKEKFRSEKEKEETGKKDIEEKERASKIQKEKEDSATEINEKKGRQRLTQEKEKAEKKPETKSIFEGEKFSLEHQLESKGSLNGSFEKYKVGEIDIINFTKPKHKDKSPNFYNNSTVGLEMYLPPCYVEKNTYDSCNFLTQDIDTKNKTPTTYKAQTLVYQTQLHSSTPQDNGQSSPSLERRLDLRQKSKAISEWRNTSIENRTGTSRDSKRKPVFSTYLTDRTAVESSRVKLTCSILSSSEPIVTWFKNGVLLDNKLKYKTKIVDGLITLEVLNAVPSDSAEYTCTVDNENGSVSTSAHLKVYPTFEASPIPPTFTRSIRDTYHLAENELVLETRIRGQPLPTITWVKDDKNLDDDERYQAYYLADGVCRLVIDAPTTADSGKYTCKAENSMWSDQITHTVNFTGKESRLGPNLTTIEKSRFNRQAIASRRPHFTNVLTDYKVSRGGTIGLQVEIKGSPSRVEWLREGHDVTELYRNAQTFVENSLYTLALTDVTEKESGLYTCRAWSSHGNVDMNAAITVVQPNELGGKAAIIVGRPEKDILISVGEDINISFRVQGEPKPKVIFMKGIREITNSQRVCKMTSDDYVKFTLKRSVVSDAGTYCIQARNAYGCDRAFVTVVVRQRASSENLISDWMYPLNDTSMTVAERKYKSVPEHIPGEPNVVDGGNNWVSLAWPKSEPQSSAPVLAYKVESWLLGKEGGARWVELGITPLNSFDAFNLKQGEEYHFRVTPKNKYGWGEPVQTSSAIRIGLAGDRPEFTEILPGQLKVLLGETAHLSCSFKGKPTPEIVWMKNGHEIEDDDSRTEILLNGFDSSLTIKDVQIEDEARYSCEASNVHGRASTYARMAVITDRHIWEADAKLKRERSAGIEGEYPPQFTMRLRDRRVQATYPVRLTCQLVGNPPPTVTWFKDGLVLSRDSRHSQCQDEHFHTLEIAPTSLEDGGVYEATARNNSGAVSCRCNLVVDKGIRAYVAPEFCCGLEPLYRLYEGEELRISAMVEAYPSVGVTWYRDGIRLRPSRRAIMTLDHDGQIELALASVTHRDAGVYMCTASNEVGQASTSGKVEVIGGDGDLSEEKTKMMPIVISPDAPYSKEPMFIRKPRSSEAREGDTVIIECEVIGDPKPDVYWLRDFLKPDYYRDANHFKRVGGGPEYRFEIPHAKLDYTGTYSVVARNAYGEAKAIISLQILAKDIHANDDAHNIKYGRVDVIPRFDKELTDLLCYDGDAIEFECRVSGDPEPYIKWLHYNEMVRDNADFETSYEEGTARLKIKQVTAEDEGTYICEASNSLGKAKSSACLVVYPPGEPNTLSQRLRRPPALLSAASTPRSTPRATPSRSLSRTPGPDARRLCSPSREVAPKFYTYPFNKVVEEGERVVFKCAVKGLPNPWATWDKDGIVITPTSRITVREKDEILRILEIEEVTTDDVGLYRITVENDYGRAEASARLEVITQKGKFYSGVRSCSASPRRTLFRRRTPSTSRQD